MFRALSDDDDDDDGGGKRVLAFGFSHGCVAAFAEPEATEEVDGPRAKKRGRLLVLAGGGRCGPFAPLPPSATDERALCRRPLRGVAPWGIPSRSSGSLSSTAGAWLASRPCRGNDASGNRSSSTTLRRLLPFSHGDAFGERTDDDDEEEEEEEEERASMASANGRTMLLGSSNTWAKKKLASACLARS